MGQPWEPRFASQGLAMFYTMAAALVSEGHRVVTLVDARIPIAVLPSEILPLSITSGEDWEKAIRTACEDSDLGIVIAPEDEGFLPKMLEAVRSTGLEVVGPDLDTAELCSDKSHCIQLFEDLAMNVPPTLMGTPEEILAQGLETLGYPAVTKPAVSSGATHLHLVQSTEELESLLDMLEEEFGQIPLIVQERVKGEDASVSLLVSPDETEVLSVNRQSISIGDFLSDSGYVGGECPLENEASNLASDSALRIAEALPGLRGYVGIDFILGDDIIVPLEVNARLTVSAVGIARTYGHSALSAILDCAEGGIREMPRPSGYAAFSESSAVPFDSFVNSEELMSIEGVVSPIILLDDSVVSPYLCGWGTSMDNARRNLGEIKSKIERRRS